MQYAREQDISMEKLIRFALKKLLETTGDNTPDSDPLFSDSTVFEGDAPTDCSSNHDRYLYDDFSGSYAPSATTIERPNTIPTLERGNEKTNQLRRLYHPHL